MKMFIAKLENNDICEVFIRATDVPVRDQIHKKARNRRTSTHFMQHCQPHYEAGSVFCRDVKSCVSLIYPGLRRKILRLYIQFSGRCRLRGLSRALPRHASGHRS